MDLILIIVASILVFALFLTILISLALRKQKPKKIFTQFTKYDFFVNEEPKTKKWWVSKQGSLEKKWMEVQDFDFKIKYFDYEENFSIGFANSKLIRTKLFLYKIMDMKQAASIVDELKTHLLCFDNIWWKEYKPKIKEIFNNMSQYSQAPEYFFYKYYFKFLTSFRNKMIYYLANYLIPNIIIAKLSRDNYKKYDINLNIDFEKNMLYSYNKIVEYANTLFETIYQEGKDDLKAKGPDWKIDYSSQENKLVNFLPEEIVIKLVLIKRANYFAKKFPALHNKALEMKRQKDLRDEIVNKQNSLNQLNN